LLETLVCNQIARQGHDVFYWRDEREREVDFVVCDGLKPSSLIQVCETIDNEKIWKRETESLLIAAEALRVNDLLLLTDNAIKSVPVEGITVKSVMDWLIGS
jgi:predicted AAA+ superfamily ATPase